MIGAFEACFGGDVDRWAEIDMNRQAMRLETHLIEVVSLVWTLFLLGFVVLGGG